MKDIDVIPACPRPLIADLYIQLACLVRLSGEQFLCPSQHTQYHNPRGFWPYIPPLFQGICFKIVTLPVEMVFIWRPLPPKYFLVVWMPWANGRDSTFLLGLLLKPHVYTMEFKFTVVVRFRIKMLQYINVVRLYLQKPHRIKFWQSVSSIWNALFGQDRTPLFVC